jgi:hypothetical protein
MPRLSAVFQKDECVADTHGEKDAHPKDDKKRAKGHVMYRWHDADAFDDTGLRPALAERDLKPKQEDLVGDYAKMLAHAGADPKKVSAILRKFVVDSEKAEGEPSADVEESIHEIADRLIEADDDDERVRLMRQYAARHPPEGGGEKVPEPKHITPEPRPRGQAFGPKAHVAGPTSVPAPVGPKPTSRIPGRPGRPSKNPVTSIDPKRTDIQQLYGKGAKHHVGGEKDIPGERMKSTLDPEIQALLAKAKKAEKEAEKGEKEAQKGDEPGEFDPIKHTAGEANPALANMRKQLQAAIGHAISGLEQHGTEHMKGLAGQLKRAYGLGTERLKGDQPLPHGGAGTHAFKDPPVGFLSQVSNELHQHKRDLRKAVEKAHAAGQLGASEMEKYQERLKGLDDALLTIPQVMNLSSKLGKTVGGPSAKKDDEWAKMTAQQKRDAEQDARWAKKMGKEPPKKTDPAVQARVQPQVRKAGEPKGWDVPGMEKPEPAKHAPPTAPVPKRYQMKPRAGGALHPNDPRNRPGPVVTKKNEPEKKESY